MPELQPTTAPVGVTGLNRQGGLPLLTTEDAADLGLTHREQSAETDLAHALLGVQTTDLSDLIQRQDGAAVPLASSKYRTAAAPVLIACGRTPFCVAISSVVSRSPDPQVSPSWADDAVDLVPAGLVIANAGRVVAGVQDIHIVGHGLVARECPGEAVGDVGAPVRFELPVSSWIAPGLPFPASAIGALGNVRPEARGDLFRGSRTATNHDQRVTGLAPPAVVQKAPATSQMRTPTVGNSADAVSVAHDSIIAGLHEEPRLAGRTFDA